MTAMTAPHRLSQTADFSVDVWLVRGTCDKGLWVADNEDGTFSILASTATEDGRDCETIGEGFSSWQNAMEAARLVEVDGL